MYVMFNMLVNSTFYINAMEIHVGAAIPETTQEGPLSYKREHRSLAHLSPRSTTNYITSSRYN